MIRKLLICGLAVWCGLSSDALKDRLKAAPSAQNKIDQSRTDYEGWTRPYSSHSLTVRLKGDEVRIRLIITAIEGDEEQSSARESSILNDKTVAYGCQIFSDGRLHYFHRSSRGAKGSGYPTLPDSDLERLAQLLAKLPDDGSRLPPAGRRLVLRTPDGDHWRVRVYDRANAPPEVVEILRLTRSHIRSWLPKFQPVSEWAAHEPSSEGALCLSADGQQIISTSSHGPLRFWDPDTREVVREVAIPQHITVAGLSLNPAGSLAAIQGWGNIHLFTTRTWQSFRELDAPMINRKRHNLSHPQFTSDGRYLLLQSSKPALLIYDTKSWEQRQTLPGLPPDAIYHYPAPRTERAIYLSKSGVLTLRDTGQRREIAKLDENVRVHRASFSPDESLVAIVTAHQVSGDYWGAYRIRIWMASDGELAHEMRPFEQGTCEVVEGLLWWPDGKYLLAATKADSFFTSRGIGVWSVQSGRHRGEFIGCPTNVTGLALLADGRRLVAGCADGRIRLWDAASGIKQIGEFESTLTNPWPRAQ